MIRSVLPDDVVAVTFDELDLSDEAALAALHPVEAEQIGGAVVKRRVEFAAARACAREAMTRLGVPTGPIIRGGRGMPVWPAGVVGTLTHTDGLRAAALAPADRVRSLGLDVEPHGPLTEGVLDAVSLPEEAAWVRAARGEVGTVHWDRLLFTAKEATYKAWFPLTRRWLGFADAHITLTPTVVDDESATGVLRSRILVDPHAVDGGPDLVEFHGRWAVRDGYVASAIVLRHVDGR
ncbi:4'-phosphopantetheinyl transferase [Rhodococcus sp. IEGM 1408]|uniref:4'-phosphopantetheinyl transferase family protein n=1 Tax=Rhodococcus sp. IEGM 1408 TaxID=3082220 RepID=UPI002954E817|nr:4'-phosphopantetheinyl transferase superfamily protein [Rhodococcus sp. IEGM 1408]MDV8000419.1 4'-phosphopantetheinyl transferase superfamily protein [Rhodococcus sp. IEGM 1408]